MSQKFENENAILKKYIVFERMYADLISRASEALAYIPSLSIAKLTINTLSIKALGKLITIEFSMVLASPQNPVGQITSSLINNPGSPQESKDIILSQWFDELGNVKGASPTENSGEHIANDNYLGTFVYKTIHCILSSNETSPRTNKK